MLQEILHRYTAIDRRDAIQPAFNAVLAIVDEVLPIEFTDLERTKEILFETDGLSSRDAIHLAIMHRYGISMIMTFDRGFFGRPGIEVVGG